MGEGLDNIFENIGIENFEPPSPTHLEGDTAELAQSESTVMFIFSSLKISLGMRHNQVGGLLANQHKFLILMCVKGMKNRDFSKIIAWYKLIYNNVP